MKRFLIPLMLLTAAPVFAHEGGRVSPEVRRQRAEARLDQLAGDLGLDTQGTAKVRATFERFRIELGPVREQTRETRRELRQALTSPQPDEQRVAQLTDRLMSSRTRLRAIEVERTQALRQELTPSQFARLMLTRHRR